MGPVVSVKLKLSWHTIFQLSCGQGEIHGNNCENVMLLVIQHL